MLTYLFLNRLHSKFAFIQRVLVVVLVPLVAVVFKVLGEVFLISRFLQGRRLLWLRLLFLSFSLLEWLAGLFLLPVICVLWRLFLRIGLAGLFSGRSQHR